MWAKGADLSHWNSDYEFAQVLRWASFVAIKATQGTRYVDPEFNDSDDHRWRTLASFGDARIAYHYQNGADALTQARHFIQVVGTVGAHFRAALDFEDSTATGAGAIVIGKEWRNHYGRRQLIYAGAKLRELPVSQRIALSAYFDLWLADWSAPFPTIYPWSAWRFLQYSGTGLDLDEFAGDRAALRHYMGI